MNSKKPNLGVNPRFEVARRKTVLRAIAHELEESSVMALVAEGGCVFTDDVLARLSRVEIWDMDDLLEVERILDALAAGGGQQTRYYRELREEARTFLLTNPLEPHWPRDAGAVRDLLHEVRLATGEASRVLAKFRLNKAT